MAPVLMPGNTRNTPRFHFGARLPLIVVAALGFLVGRWTSASAEAGSNRRVPPAPVALASVAHDRPGDAANVAAGPTPSVWSTDAWQRLRGEPATDRRNHQLAALVEALAEHAPEQALRLVEGETNLLLRENLLEAALRGWAHTAPLAAGRWAFNQPDPASREAAFTAVFSGAVAANSADAVAAGNELIAEHPEEAVGLGSHLIDALCHAGEFAAAARFAASGTPSLQGSWIGGAYANWAALQPEDAAQAAAAVPDAATRSLALHGVIGGWTRADPAAAVNFAVQLPDDADRSSLVSQALLRWTRVDLKAASDWINTHDLGPALDQGVAAVATRDYLKPDVAVSWAESVSDPKLRSATLVDVLRRWATTDLAGARQYFESTTYLAGNDRQEVAGVIATLSGQAPAAATAAPGS